MEAGRQILGLDTYRSRNHARWGLRRELRRRGRWGAWRDPVPVALLRSRARWSLWLQNQAPIDPGQGRFFSGPDKNS